MKSASIGDSSHSLRPEAKWRWTKTKDIQFKMFYILMKPDSKSINEQQLSCNLPSK